MAGVEEFTRARALDEAGDFVEAARLYVLAAKKGHVTAHLNLGYCYEMGEGVEKDMEKAFMLYFKAATKGSAGGQNNVGTMFASGEGVEKNVDTAFRFYQMAAIQRNIHGLVNLGCLYKHGKGTKQNLVEAAKCFRFASDKGHSTAHLNLAYAYELGEGVDKDLTEAVRLFRLAHEGGLAEAASSLGYMYDLGTGVEKNTQEAVRFYLEAADKGIVQARYNLGVIYRDGELGKPDFPKALHMFEGLANEGDKRSIAMVGEMYMKGEGVRRNCDTALVWFNRAIFQKDVDTKVIAIQKEARELLKKEFSVKRRCIRDGDSVMGEELVIHDNILHFAARHRDVAAIAMLFNHAKFDILLRTPNKNTYLPHQVLTFNRPVQAIDRTLKSILCISRRGRAACILFCLENLPKDSLWRAMPFEMIREIITKGVLPPKGDGNLNCNVRTLLASPGAWPPARGAKRQMEEEAEDAPKKKNARK